MIKRIISLFIILCLCVALCACEQIENGRFQTIEHKAGVVSYAIIVDTETGVLYIQINGGITVLLDENGKPLTWEDWEGEDDD